LTLVQKVMEVNPKTVVVLLNGGPISLAPPYAGGQRPTTLSFPTVVDIFWPGEEGGTAIADVLFGDYNPSGRLPYTVYGTERLLPPMTEYDISKGFTYMYLAGNSVFSFGRGLSYTTFQYTNLKVSSPQIASNATVKINVDVRNTGSRAGDEIVQLYVHNNDSSDIQPKKQLQGFERVSISPGETKTVTFSLPVEQLAFWGTGQHAFILNPAKFDVLVGSASDDIRATGSFQVTTSGRWPGSELTTRAADGDYSTQK